MLSLKYLNEVMRLAPGRKDNAQALSEYQYALYRAELELEQEKSKPAKTVPSFHQLPNLPDYSLQALLVLLKYHLARQEYDTVRAILKELNQRQPISKAS